ncbi:hypothetical protein JVU11DRAFT_4533 [Chiua virens]|nr:hypothetical protein JVU11DRAFT_4533 [Chiua virens]
MSAVDSQIQLTPPVEHRRRRTPEIIDLDELDTDDIIFVGSSRPNQRRHVEEHGRAGEVTGEVINLTDDEDDGEIQFVGHNPARPQPPLVARARLFSPPPPPQIGGIPPVPQIPERFIRPRPPPGLVIPNEDPFPFEADLRPSPPVEQAPPVAAPPSHHVPPMGFGGALLAGVRRIIGPRNNSHRSERRNGWGMSGSFIMRWDPFDLPGERDYLLNLEEMGLFGEEDNQLGAGRVRSQLEYAFKRDREDRAEPDYKPHYTHPDRPLPGFTHDLSPASASSPVSEENDTSPARQCQW